MDLVLWIVAGLLAAVYLFSGGGKLIVSKDKIATMSTSAEWVEDFDAGTVKAIAVFEILGALGLVLPAVLDIAPVLVPLSALGLAVIMLGAVITRVRRHEPKFMMADLVYLALTGFVAWGRFGPEAFAA